MDDSIPAQVLVGSHRSPRQHCAHSIAADQRIPEFLTGNVERALFLKIFQVVGRQVVWDRLKVLRQNWLRERRLSGGEVIDSARRRS